MQNVVRLYLSGDKSAFKEIQEYLNPVINQVLHTKRYPGYAEHVEDIRQECWLDTIKNLQYWDSQRGTLKNFMFKCYANRIMVYLHRQGSEKKFCQVEEIQESVPSETINTYVQDIDISIISRFSDPREAHIINAVWIATWLRVFDGEKNKIIKELRQTTGFSIAKVRFIVDYALVLLRKYCLEVGLWVRERSVVS